MSEQSDPPILPPDSPGSSVSSRLQNEYDDVIKHTTILPNGNLTTKSTKHQNTLVFEPPASNKKNEIATNLIDLSSPEIRRTETTQHRDRYENDGILPTTTNTSFHQYPDPLAQHLHRYSELVTSTLESKPITEKMDHWYLDMKKNLMNEFDQLRLQYLEEAQQTALREKQSQAKEYIRLNEDIKTMREMLVQYENIIDQKDQTERNLSRTVDLLNQKTVAYQRYYQWRLASIEKRRENYALALAKHFYEDKLQRKVLSQWRLITEREWKKRFEYECEKKSKTVLYQLGQEYDLKYQELEMKLLRANEEIARLRNEKTDQDENLRKAFMRGVCALNMEAMGVLLKDDGELDSINHDHRQQIQSNSSNNLSSDEGVTFTGSSTGIEDEQGLRSSSYNHRYPTHVYKEYLPNTVYRTGEARPYRTNQHRHVTFRQHSSTNSRNNPVVVERHTSVTRPRS